MKPWKVMLGIGAACAVCCAIPLVAAAGGLALFGSALFARLEAFVPASMLLFAGGAAVLAAGVWWLREHRLASADAGCGCAGSCSKEVGHAGN